MLRRSHKKFRGGCLECKRRHVKCDGRRPVCLLCTMSERDCSYPSQAPPEKLSPSDSSSQEQSISPGDNHSQGLDEAINLNHMELLVHVASDKSMFNLGHSPNDYPSDLFIALKKGLKAPYLMYMLLAFSARHLAFLHPQQSAFYLHQAMTLQTRAVSLFNAAWTGVDQSNCVAVLGFSSILGHHLLADTLAKRDPGGLEGFISHYTQCVEMHRGIHTIATNAWPLLMATELQPILSLSADFTSRAPRGNHCQRIRELVDTANGLGEEDKEACRLAIQYLQVGFDAVLAEEEQSNRYQMIFSWTMLVPPEFTRLLAAKRPEVLVLLAYYSLLLHYGRNLWQVGDAGAYILGIIVDYLGPEWDHWLEYPRERITRKPL
ncbi:putative C6 finger domain protein [Mytilinidion resinicola]|uniref:C6 finger domain protein n=1 Tax=Mytilinidion resinicola TaxID=574789 RepID=A0A6A6ZA27_9PEZI|nr:putative C6 finger domain protein [Mytilinidion resinicola]KAF2817549.1 putative C6 finger domain protein [Mytilinidion resinicola]